MAAIITFSVGMSYGAYTMLIEPLAQRLGCGLTAAGLPATFENIACFTTGLLISGWLIEKWTARCCMLINAFITIFFVASYAYMPSIPLLCGWEAITGASMAFGFTTALSAFVRKWFISRREAVLGVALASNGLGAATGVWLFTFLESNFGIDLACGSFAGIGFFCVLLGLIVLRDPEQIGQKPFGWETMQSLPVGTGQTAADTFGISFQAALRTPSLYLIMCSCLLCCMSMVMSPYFATILLTNGVEKMQAANYATVNQLALAISSVAFGSVTAKYGEKFFVIVALGSATMGLAALGGWLAFPSASGLIWVAAVFLGGGFCIGNTYGPIVTTKVFGNKCYDRVIPLIYAMRGVGLALGVLLMPSLAEKQGNWAISIILGICAMIIAIVLGLLGVHLAPMKNVRDSAKQTFNQEKGTLS